MNFFEKYSRCLQTLPWVQSHPSLGISLCFLIPPLFLEGWIYFSVLLFFLAAAFTYSSIECFRFVESATLMALALAQDKSLAFYTFFWALGWQFEESSSEKLPQQTRLFLLGLSLLFPFLWPYISTCYLAFYGLKRLKNLVETLL